MKLRLDCRYDAGSRAEEETKVANIHPNDRNKKWIEYTKRPPVSRLPQLIKQSTQTDVVHNYIGISRRSVCLMVYTVQEKYANSL